MHSLVLKKRFPWKKQFCSKNCIFISLGKWECFLFSCRQCYGRFAEISLCKFKRTVWRLGFLESLSFFDRFPISSKSFQKFDENFFGRVATTAFCVSRCRFFSIFERRKEAKPFFSKKLRCYPFQTLSEKDPMYFCRHGYGRLVKTSLYIFIRKIGQIGFLESSSFFHNFSNSSKKFSEFWQETCGRVVTTSFYMYRGTFWGKIFSFLKVHIFRRFRNLSCKYVDFQRKIFGRVSKLHSPLVRNRFD